MTQDGTPKDDVKVPDSDLGTEIQSAFDDGKELLVTIVSAMGEEQVRIQRPLPALSHPNLKHFFSGHFLQRDAQGLLIGSALLIARAYFLFVFIFSMLIHVSHRQVHLYYRCHVPSFLTHEPPRRHTLLPPSLLPSLPPRCRSLRRPASFARAPISHLPYLCD
jgi:hypothetical protein